MSFHGSRPASAGRRIPSGPDLRVARAAGTRIGTVDGRAPMYEAGRLPPLPIRPLPEPPAGWRSRVRLWRASRRPSA